MSRWISMALAFGLMCPGALQAQVQPPAAGQPAANYNEIKGLLDAIEARVTRMNQRADDADQQLQFLNDQVDEAISLLSSRQDENVALREKAVGLLDQRDNLQVSREDLRGQLARVSDERDVMLTELETRIADIARQLEMEQRSREELRTDLNETRTAYAATVDQRDGLSARLGQTEQALTAEKEQVTAHLLEIESLNRDIAALRDVRSGLEREIVAITAAAAAAEKGLTDERIETAALTEQFGAAKALGEELTAEMGALRDRRAELESRLADEQGRTELAQRELDAREIRLAELQAALTASQQATDQRRQEAAAADDRIGLLNSQLGELKVQLAALNGILAASEDKNREREAVIADLQVRLDQALVSKVQELARYRSEFFGRLREVLGERPDISIVGDRFVFQSEVLFATGAAVIGADGQAQLVSLASTLSEIAETIPADVDWVLRVDGHTDDRPIRTPHFPSNWELSTARATSVVKFLIEKGIAPERLAPAGFGEFHPIDPGEDDIAYRRNRRIEFKLTQR